MKLTEITEALKAIESDILGVGDDLSEMVGTKIPIKDAKRKVREFGGSYRGVWDGPIGDAHQFWFDHSDERESNQFVRWLKSQGVETATMSPGRDGTKRAWAVEVSVDDLDDPERLKEPTAWGPAVLDSEEVKRIAVMHGGEFAGEIERHTAEGSLEFGFGKNREAARKFSSEIGKMYKRLAPGDWAGPTYVSKSMGFDFVPRDNWRVIVYAETIK